MKITESMIRAGWKKRGDTWYAPAAPPAVVREAIDESLPLFTIHPKESVRSCKESFESGYRALGLNAEAARIAAGIEVRSLNDGLQAMLFGEATRRIMEQDTSVVRVEPADPLAKLGTLTPEFIKTRDVLIAAGYVIGSVNTENRVVAFSKADCRDVLVMGNGEWQFATAKDDSFRGRQDPCSRLGNNEVNSGRNAFELSTALMLGAK